MSISTIRGIALIATIAALIGFGYWIAANKHGRQIAEIERNHALAVESFTTEARAIEQQLQDAVADIDRQHWETLKDAQTEIDALRRAVAAGSKRVYVKADCPAGMSTDATYPGVGNGGQRARLDPASAERIFGIAGDGDSAIRQLTACQSLLRVCRDRQ